MTTEQAIKIIENHTNEKVVDAHQITGRGQVNQIYVLKTPKTRYILRTDLKETTTNRFEKELWCTKVSNKYGVLSPEVMTIGLEDGHPYMITLFVDGTNGDESAEKDSIWKTLGLYAKKLHSIPVKGFGERMAAPGVFKDSWEDYLDYNILNLNENDKAVKVGLITKEQSKKIKEIFLSLKDANLRFGLSHCDLSLKNTIMAPDGKVQLIDWGSAKVVPAPHMDIAEILNSSLDENSDQFSLFISGYGISRAEYEKIRPEIARLSLLTYMNKFRWATKKERIDHFSKKVKEKVAYLIYLGLL